MARRSILGFAVIILALAAAAARAVPVEQTSTTADQERVGLTIYNAGSSLVHDRRRVDLGAGESAIAWRDVSASMDATTAILADLTSPGGTSVLEQNFNYDLLKPATLLDKYVGRKVTVVHDRAVRGAVRTETATLLSDNEGVVLKYADRVETGLYDSHIVFPSIPPNLRDRPTLVLDLRRAQSGPHDLDLSYLTAGLGWQADYVGVVSPNEDRMDVSGLVTVSNATGTTYVNAHVQLVAGNVNFSPAETQDTYTVGRVPMAAPTPVPVRQENFFEYHLYTLPRPSTVANAQTKQIALLAAKRVPVRKTLELRGSDSYYSNREADLGQKLPVGVYLTFVNKGGDLGVPLPGGDFRLYKNDSRGKSQFLGSDRIDHTPRDRPVRLHLGDSFDVTANKKQTDFRGLGGCTYESAYRVEIANAKDVQQSVLVVEQLPGTWSIVAENEPHEKSSSATATWTLRVPARRTSTLTYRARVSPCL